MMLAFSPCRATDSLRQLKNQPFRVAHKTAQDAPERSLKRSKMASETAKMAQDGLQDGQDGLQHGQDGLT